MPNTKSLSLKINNEDVELGDLDDLGFKMNYTLEEPDNFMSKQGAEAQSLQLPATKNNDKIFNTFHNPQVEDTSSTAVGVVTSATTSFSGTGYAIGDTVSINDFGSGTPAVLLITNVGVGGAVTGFTIITVGSGYTDIPIVHVTTTLTGVGVGFSVTITFGNGVSAFRELMPCIFNVNGTVPVLLGYAQLTDCSFTDKPESYGISVFGANGQWVVDAQNLTLWDCVNPASHNFTVLNVENSWGGYNTAGDGSDDYVYAPVRYRQPFDGTTLGYGGDNCVNIYHLRPSISAYWLLRRGFESIGYKIKSQFMETDYFQRLVLPWTWGGFYDIDSQLTQGICFQAAGILPDFATEPPPTEPSSILLWVGAGSGTLFPSTGGSTWYNLISGGWDPAEFSPGAGLPASIGNGIIYNTQVSTISIVSGGTGYVGGDVVDIDSKPGTTKARINVLTVGGSGEILTASVGSPGDATSQWMEAGRTCTTTAVTGVGAGATVLILINSSFSPIASPIAASSYVYTGGGIGTGGSFEMTVDTPPEGYDNFSLYSFDSVTGTMIYDLNPPPSIITTVTNLSINFTLSILSYINPPGTPHPGEALLALEVLHIKSGGTEHVLTVKSVMPTGGAVSSLEYNFGVPMAYRFTVPDCNPGDQLRFRLVCLEGGSSTIYATFGIASGGYLNNNPQVLGASSYQYNPVTQQFDVSVPRTTWSPIYSKMTMTGFLIQLGNQVNMKNYDAFRNYQFLDFFAGLIDMFNMEVQSDNDKKEVTIEPMFGSTLPTGEVIDGYFSTTRILDYTDKVDMNKASRMELFSSTQRQLDLTFKLDSNDGGQNIWALRNKGIYLANRNFVANPNSANVSNIGVNDGIIAGIPGAARYMLPNRFAKGNRQMQNRFFSAVMHCTFPQWENITGVPSPIPQLITIFPENSSSAESFAQAYTPKLAWYAGHARSIATTGGWIWIGDPANPIPPLPGPGPTGYNLPFMFAVNYGTGGATDPRLSYCDENIAGVKESGLMTQFYLKRFAVMRNGQLLTTNLRLNLNDMCNWEHQECIMIDGTLYALIQIDGYDPLKDESTPTTLWKVVDPMQIDVDNSYPSTQSIITQPLTLSSSYDVRYARLLLYPTDLPQIG